MIGYNNRRFILIAIMMVFPVILFSQVRFPNDKLKDPGKYGKEISSKIPSQEVFEYRKEAGNCVFLKAGLRSANFVNEKDWTSIMDSVDAYRVDIVYSKYPLRNGVYKEIYPLLFSRLRSLFAVDPYLNDTSVEFRKILQTNCINDDQVKGLFHGIVIWYRQGEEQEEKELLTSKPEQVTDTVHQKYQVFLNRSSVKELEQVVENITSSPFFPDTLKESIKGRSLDEKADLINDFLEESIKNDTTFSVFRPTEEKLKEFGENINFFLSKYGNGDKVVFEVLDRHPEWQNMIVVNDWTGSMYGYGAQVLEWHLLNREKSGITALTLFNDGDAKRDYLKKIGSTEGIYSDKADDITKLVKLFNLVMLRGGGGDAPENDIEAILSAIEEFPDCSNVLLIADYYSCVRDILLADRIKVPVKIILCGYGKGKPMNPDYIYLAKVTGGGIYTIEEDIENLKAEVSDSGRVVKLTDDRFEKGLMDCGRFHDILISDSLTLMPDTIYSNLKDIKKTGKKIRKVDLSNSGLKRIPGSVLRNENLTYLNLSNNKIKRIPKRIRRLQNLNTLILSHNSIDEIGDDVSKVLYLEKFEISDNKITEIPVSLLGMKFITSMDLSNNKISSLPNSNALKKIENLDLSGNQIKTLPRAFGKMKKLKSLNLSSNLIEVIPTSLTALTKLKELDLSNNNISVIPTQVKKWKKMKILNLEGNKLNDDEKKKVKAVLPGAKVSL